MKRILAIDGNAHSIEALRNSLSSGRAIAFVGAGASAGLYPLWKELIRKLASETITRGLASQADHDYWISNTNSNSAQVVKGIKSALTHQTYGSILRDIFSPKVGPDGKRYTPIQSVILRMQFRGIVTTNYDPGIIEARHAECPEMLATGYSTWRDRDDLDAWITKDIFTDHSCPIMFAHGIYQRSDTIVLGVDEYREAYRQKFYRRFIEKLWGEESLVIIGYGFSDAWLNVISEEVTINYGETSARKLRHVALIGLYPNQTYTPEMRRSFHDAYSAEVIFYPIVLENSKEDHSALHEILETVKNRNTVTSSPPPLIHHTQSFQQLWVHETTNDERYTPPQFSLSRLDRWANDPSVRAIAVTGIGGQGKTALIGHWLKTHGGDGLRPYDGLFFWSFYANRAVPAFFDSLLRFIGADDLTTTPTRQNVRSQKKTYSIGKERVSSAIEALESTRLLLVLDGLEVLQERPGTSAYGTLLEQDLREFLDAACNMEEYAGLVVLTSRFPFADLTPHLGSSLRALELDRLNPDEGAALLAQCKVGGTVSDRKEISRRLEGHPLALRVFSAALATQVHGDPSRLWNMVFQAEGLSEDDPLEGKLIRLLRFYDAHLPSEQRILMGIVSLFGAPIDEAVVMSLARKQSAPGNNAHSNIDSQLFKALNVLVDNGLLLCEHSSGLCQYACHPVLRDHFRSAIINRNEKVASEAAFVLTDQPAYKRPRDVRELMPVLTAIELLLEAGYVCNAHDLYHNRLKSGKYFLTLPAVDEGRRCAMAFVASKDRMDRCLAQLSSRDLAWYLNSVGLFAGNAGEPEEAVTFYRESETVSQNTRDTVNLTITRRNLSAMLTSLGKLSEAEEMASVALWQARRGRNELVKSACHAELAFILGLQGRVDDAAKGFSEAIQTKHPEEIDSNLHSVWETKEADFLTRVGCINQAQQLLVKTLKVSKERNWRNDIARCRWLLGSLDIINSSQLERAEKHLSYAEFTFRRGHMLTDLPSVLLTKAMLCRIKRQWIDSLRYIKEAINISAPRQLQLAHADALVMRSRVTLDRSGQSNTLRDESSVYAALDDAEAALQLARRCNYVWAEKQALYLLNKIWAVLRNELTAKRYLNEATILSSRLRLRETLT